MRRRARRDVMVKSSEPFVVAHSGLAAKQCVGTRGHPATVTDKTALLLEWWVLVGEEKGKGKGGGRASRVSRVRVEVWGGERAAAKGARSAAM